MTKWFFLEVMRLRTFFSLSVSDSFPIHPDGLFFGGVIFLCAVVLWWLWVPLGLIGLLLMIWCFWFFRNPRRDSLEDEAFVLSPADGVVCEVVRAVAPEESGVKGEYRRISIFMNIFDVHLNRLPVSGKIEKVVYRGGKFFRASLNKASVHNERCVVVLEEKGSGERLIVVQIAGFIARRIRCDVEEGEEVKRGLIFGLIRFGSRVDVYVPMEWQVLVKSGYRSVGGETLLSRKA